MKINMSKKQWAMIGKKAGWTKESQTEESVSQPYLVDDLIAELEKYRGFKVAFFSDENGAENIEKRNAPIVGNNGGFAIYVDQNEKRLLINF